MTATWKNWRIKSTPATDSTIAVALSGGADSLYSLISLRRAKAKVFALHALFLPAWLRPAEYANLLAGLEKNCAALGVPLHLADCSDVFESRVIRSFSQSYASGLTPNPCAGCNRDLKFGLLWEKASELGADLLVTGHYARLLELKEGPALLAGLDHRKDQSYFLALTPLQRLARARFPVGGLQKSDILAELAASGVEVPQKRESQEICFITDNDYRAFLLRYAARSGLPLPGPGPVLLPDGREIARHKGLWAYTEGQRHGLGIAWSEPLYVLGKIPEKNALLVGTKADFDRRAYLCGYMNYLVPPDEWPETVLAKTRYRQELKPARAARLPADETVGETAGGCGAGSCGGELLRLEFLEDAAAPPSAPGQVAAIYAPVELENPEAFEGEPGQDEGKLSQDLRLLAGGIILPDR